MKFTVKRSKWVRGGQKAMHKYGPPQLLNANGRMCCLGFVCKKLGASNRELERVGFPSDCTKVSSKFLELFPDKAGTSSDDPDSCLDMFEEEATRINDDSSIAPNTREALLKKLFRSRGHEIVFVP